MYKLVAIDLDGTLLNSKKEISETNKKAVQRAIDKGVKIVVCSGRIYAGARIYAKQINTNAPIIACNGAVIKDIVTGEVLYSNNMTNDACTKIVDICKDADIYFHIYIDDTMYIEKLAFSSLAYKKLNDELPDEDKINIKLVKDLKEVLQSSTLSASKVVVISRDSELLLKTRKKIESLTEVDVMSSNFDNFEAVNTGVNKGNALRVLAHKFNISSDEVIAIGDNENDYAMIKYAGLGAAMGNAEDLIKRTANFITFSNDEDGVAEVLNKFIL